MTTPARKTIWQRLRLMFRWCRICLWLLLLAVVAGFIYVNRVGLPDIVKNRVLAELHDRGVDVEFKRLRLRWYQGFVAEGINVGRAGESRGPQMTIDEATLKLDGEALCKFQIKLNGVMVRNGRLVWPLLVSNQPASELKLENISTEIRFQADDLWKLDHFQARSFGIKLQASGAITNATRIRDHLPQKRRDAGTVDGRRDSEAGLRRLVAVMEQLRFTADPEIEVTFGGDAAVTNHFDVQLKCKAAGARTPWGTWENFLLSFQAIQTPATNLAPSAVLQLDIAAAQTQWATGRVARLSVQLHAGTNDLTAVQADWSLSLADVSSRWASGSNLEFTGRSVRAATNSAWLQTAFELKSGQLHTEWLDSSSNHIVVQAEHYFTNPIPLKADCTVQLLKPTTRWGRAESVAVTLHSRQDVIFTRRPDAAEGWWTPIEPFAFDWECRFRGVDTEKLTLEDFSLAGEWRAPQIQLRNFEAHLYGGNLQLEAQLDVLTRRLAAQGGFDFDVQHIKPLLNTNGQKWINQFSWDRAPKVKALAAITLPPWTNTTVDFKSLLPSLALDGHVECGPGAYRQITFDSASTTFSLSNSAWHLPDLTAHRPEGDAVLDYTSHAVTQDYHWGIRSHIDPNILKPFFETEKEQKIFSYFQLTGPPVIEGDIWGRWYARERTGFDARFVITNFIVRGEGCSNLSARVQFTNSTLDLTDIRIERGEQLLSGGPARIDFDTLRLSYTNIHSTLDPIAAMNVIGPKTVEAIKPYKFFTPPTVTTYGSMNLKDIDTTDLHFFINGGQFNYWRFNLTTITGVVHWVTNKLFLENVHGPFYSGTILGDAEFDFEPRNGSLFNFHALATDANLHTLIADLVNATNKLEGVFTTDLHITSAYSTNWDSWQGYGKVTMRDGLLWEAPVFGIFSPILNGVSPGLGNTKASDARATYTITNSVIVTSDLEIHSAPVRLRYAGTVDFDARVNARVEADIFREAPLIGQIIRLFTKVFEYKVTGTLSQPKSEPVFFVPRLFKFPLSPFKTLKELFTSDSDKLDKARPVEPKPVEKPLENP